MQIKEFLNAVCEQIKYKPIRNSISEELENHIEESKENYIEEGMQEEEAEEKEAIRNDEDCKKSGAGFGPEKRNGTKKSRHGTVDSFRWILGRGRIGVPAGGKTVHRAVYRSVFPAGSTNVHCAVSVA